MPAGGKTLMAASYGKHQAGTSGGGRVFLAEGTAPPRRGGLAVRQQRSQRSLPPARGVSGGSREGRRCAHRAGFPC